MSAPGAGEAGTGRRGGSQGDGALAVTWWGHASATVELGGVRVGIDPLLVDRLFHLRRHGATPAPSALDVDVVLISHLHADHCHLPSLARLDPRVPLVVPQGSEALLARLGRERLIAVSPGQVVEVAGVRVEVLGASHDGRRLPWSGVTAPALGFRVSAGGRSLWFPGDTGLRDDMADVAPVDLALAPIGGWGPSLGEGHMGPADAADAVRRVGARWALGVHWGTFWPLGLDRVARANHHHLFTTPGQRFADALAGPDLTPGPGHGDQGGAAPVEVLAAAHGERVVLR